jgi:hypothetical protein
MVELVPESVSLERFEFSGPLVSTSNLFDTYHQHKTFRIQCNHKQRGSLVTFCSETCTTGIYFPGLPHLRANKVALFPVQVSKLVFHQLSSSDSSRRCLVVCMICKSPVFCCPSSWEATQFCVPSAWTAPAAGRVMY